MALDYASVSTAVAATGMIVRGGFTVDPDGPVPVPAVDDGRPCRTVLVIGNVRGAMWERFRAEEAPVSDPLDHWTRRVLRPIAERFDATYVHPSDEPFQPFQRWAGLADDVWPSPIGLLVHPEHGLWHAYRGAFLFPVDVPGLPGVGSATSPCLDCADQPCLTACPVDAFTPDGYDSAACANHVRSGREPTCLDRGCAARRACPIGADRAYGSDQMRFHMRAFVGS